VRPERELLLALAEDEWLMLTEHVPDGDVLAVVVICHGLTGDKRGPQALLTLLGRRLAAQGYATIRFDFRGSAESSGSFAATTFKAMCDDLRAVCRYARGSYRAPLILAGLSIGGVVPALVASTEPACRGVVLLSSDLIEGVEFVTPSAEVPIRGGEFTLPAAFFRERETLWPRSELAEAGVPVLAVYGAEDTKIVREAPALQRAGFQTECISGADHLFENVEARRRMVSDVVDFVSAQVTREGVRL
jgi:uncharacterized protein